MYSTPTPMGRPSTFRGDAGGGGSKLSRPRVSMGTALTSPTLSTTSTRSAVMGRKSLSSSASASSSPVGSRSTSMTTNGSPETIRVGDTVRAPSGEVGTVKYTTPFQCMANQDLWALSRENRDRLLESIYILNFRGRMMVV